MTRTCLFLVFGLLLLGACTIAGDVVDPPRELKANCNIANAEPVPQTGLATTPPRSADKI